MCLSQPKTIPVRELWDGLVPRQFEDGSFVILRGFIDESYDGTAIPEVFTLSCIVSWGSEWTWIEMAWKKVLDDKNASLIAEGRRPLSRYHATDCNARENEFKGWTRDERDEFVLKLFKVFPFHDTSHIAMSLSVRELLEIWGGDVKDPMSLAYDLLLVLIMNEIGITMEQENFKSKIALIYERSDYGPVMLDTFIRLMDRDDTFRFRDIFTTIAPMGWEDCVPLQLADLVAFESFTNARRMRDEQPKGMRKSLEALLSMDSVGARSKGVSRKALASLKAMVDARVSRLKQEGKDPLKR